MEIAKGICLSKTQPWRVKCASVTTVACYLNISVKLLPQCSLGTVTLEVGRIKASPFHSERRPSQSSQVGSCGIHQGDAVHMPKGTQRGPWWWVCLGSWTQVCPSGSLGEWGAEFETGKSRSWRWTGKQGVALEKFAGILKKLNCFYDMVVSPSSQKLTDKYMKAYQIM